MSRKSVQLIGILIAVAAYVWWSSELSRLGPDASKAAFACLIRFGTGACGTLWWVGLHQTNQIASLIFYGGIGFALFGLIKKPKLPQGPTDSAP